MHIHGHHSLFNHHINPLIETCHSKEDINHMGALVHHSILNDSSFSLTDGIITIKVNRVMWEETHSIFQYRINSVITINHINNVYICNKYEKYFVLMMIWSYVSSNKQFIRLLFSNNDDKENYVELDIGVSDISVTLKDKGVPWLDVIGVRL